MINFCTLTLCIVVPCHPHNGFKGSFTLAAAVCGFGSGLHQCRDRNFSISVEQCNRLPQTHAENAVM